MEGRGGGVKGEDKGEKKRGGGRSDGQEGRRRSNRRGKVTKSRGNGKTLTVDMNSDSGCVLARLPLATCLRLPRLQAPRSQGSRQPAPR